MHAGVEGSFFVKSQYSVSTIISEAGSVNLREIFKEYVAILCEYDYIRRVPLESLAW